MRLGGLHNLFTAENIRELEKVCQKLDCYGLSTIPAPLNLKNFSNDESIEFGTRAKKLGLIIGDAGFWEDLMTYDKELQLNRIKIVREMLKKADLMGCLSVVTLVVGKVEKQGNLAEPMPYMFENSFENKFSEVVLRILDGLDLKVTKYLIEPYHNTFFYQPEAIYKFLLDVNHPSFGLHLDLANMVSQKNYFHTSELIQRTFKILRDYIGSVHFKDIKLDIAYSGIKYDEVFIGEGVIDYETYIKHVNTLSPDITCYCEHLNTEQDFALNFARLHYLAYKQGLKFLKRVEKT